LRSKADSCSIFRSELNLDFPILDVKNHGIRAFPHSRLFLMYFN
jgi:hypothetical protein